MNDFIILYHIRLKDLQRPKELSSDPVKISLRNVTDLQIVKSIIDDGFYLIYLDTAGVKLAKSYHVSIEEAIQRAETEFHAEMCDWRKWKG